MTLIELHKLNKESILKYLAYLQICSENSAHLQTLQDLQNRILNGEDILSNNK